MLLSVCRAASSDRNVNSPIPPTSSSKSLKEPALYDRGEKTALHSFITAHQLPLTETFKPPSSSKQQKEKKSIRRHAGDFPEQGYSPCICDMLCFYTYTDNLNMYIKLEGCGGHLES